GVSPLVWAIGAGAELRQALGTAVFFGMIGVTAFGLIFTPVFYVIARWVASWGPRRGQEGKPASQAAEQSADG
ncbi:MAG: efflux RND transporter permease subunit, partial [Hyphomicrobiales bacterium]|nr:efflux RND transporter permease subunit [Hyphomicrobiales bacterium]